MTRFVLSVVLLAGWVIPIVAEETSKSLTSSKSKDALCTCVCEEQPKVPQRVFELRTYYLNDGKLGDLHKRFRDHTCALLKKHGAELIGFWTPTDEKDGKGGKLIYLVAFPSRDAAKKTWEAFGNDPEWRKVYSESHKNGVLVKKVDSVFLEPTDYSAIK